MFGLYEFKLPESWMTRLTQLSNNQKSGNYLGVFMMGVLSGLIASPCTTAPLSAALLYVAQSGDYLVGGLTLYVLSLGMGLPLLLLGTSGGKLLPKAGGWMEQVKTLFGFIMLVFAGSHLLSCHTLFTPCSHLIRAGTAGSCHGCRPRRSAWRSLPPTTLSSACFTSSSCSLTFALTNTQPRRR